MMSTFAMTALLLVPVGFAMIALARMTALQPRPVRVMARRSRR